MIAAQAGTTRVQANAIATTPRIGAVAVTTNSSLRPRAGHPESLGLGRRIEPCCLDVVRPGEPAQDRAASGQGRVGSGLHAVVS
jgi:hypothetical protein